MLRDLRPFDINMESPQTAADRVSVNEVAMTTLITNEGYIEALAMRMALKWLAEESQESAVVKFFECGKPWQLVYLRKCGLVALVESPGDIAANSSCIGFQATKVTPPLVAAVEQLRSCKPAALPALIVPHNPCFCP